VVDLRDEGVVVAGCFKRGAGLVGGRVVKAGPVARRLARNARRAAKAGITNGGLSNGHGQGHVNEEEQVVINGNGNGNGAGHDEAEKSNGHTEEKGEEEDSDDEDVKDEIKVDEEVWVKTLAASEDGQWLGIGDLSGSVSIVNLDTLRVSPHHLNPYPQLHPS
jgi:hypothetical protein